MIDFIVITCYNNTMKKYILTAIVSLLSATAQAQIACVGDPSGTPRSAYIVPQLASSQLFAAWAPILERVGRDTNQCFDIKISQSIPEFEVALNNGRADYAFMNPYHQVMFKRNYVPLVADFKTKLDGLVVVRADSPYKTIQDLRGARVAFPAPNAFAATLLIRSTMASNNIPIIAQFANTHSNVYRAVILGDAQAGGGVNNTYDREPQAVKDKLRVIYTTQGYTPHPFSASVRISTKDREATVRAFIRIASTPDGQAQLDKIQMPQPYPVTYSNNYQILETLNLARFVQNGTN